MALGSYNHSNRCRQHSNQRNRHPKNSRGSRWLWGRTIGYKSLHISIIRRNEDLVDHVDNSVRGENILGCNCGFVNLYNTICNGNFRFTFLQGGYFLIVFQNARCKAKVTITDGVVKIDKATVTAKDVFASNGEP